jgi:hypothetical protein
MLSRRGLGVLALLSLSACVGSEPAGPGGPLGVESPAVSAAIVDGSTTGSPHFFFQPPLGGNSSPTGTFNPDLLPAMRVCVLVGAGCGEGGTVAFFPPGSIPVSSSQYQLNWDTDGPETGVMDSNLYYQLQIVLGGRVVGSIDLDPQDPNGPGQSTAPGFYAFRLGETIPVKFWISTQVFCEVDGVVVLECITNAVIDENGGELTLDQAGDPLSVFLPQGALPGDNHPPILMTVERVDPDQFFQTEGVACIPLLDAPQFGPCFRVTTIPELTAELDASALVTICVDAHELPQLNLPEEQDHQIQIIRFATDGSGDIETLPAVTGDCPVETASLFDVPDDGFLRYAAIGANWLARAVGPQPVHARTNLRLSGLTSSFSRFRFGLPGRMSVVSGDGAVIQASDAPDVLAVIEVRDQAGIPVEAANLHFSTEDGTTDILEALTGEDGRATVAWTVDDSTPGEKALSVSALGLLITEVPEHSNGYPLTTQTLTLTAYVVGPPAAVDASPAENIEGTAGEVAGELTIVVTDAGGAPVEGAAVTWTGDGSVSGGDVTDENGSATGTWTLPTTAGENTMTATVGTVSATFTATGAPGGAATLVIGGDGQTGGINQALPAPLSAQVVDQYGNPRAGDVVTWSVSTGGGSIAGTSPTNASGTATATWTLGSALGAQTATVSTGSLSHTYTATGVCALGGGAVVVDGTFGATEWACAGRMTFSANVSGGSTPAEAYWQNDGQNLYLAVRVRRSALDNVNSVRFDFDNDGDGVTELNDDAIGYDAGTRAFLDQYLTSRCLNSNQANCGADDTVRNGSAAVRNDGTWTTYELSHPLTGGGAQDFSRTAGQQLGFFLTLRVGNGAQGNTQVPNFRTYRQITITGP